MISVTQEQISHGGHSVSHNTFVLARPMPPLPNNTVGLDLVLEEPHCITGSANGIDFSPTTGMVQNPPFSAPVVMLGNNGTDLASISGITGSITDQVVREGLML